MIHVQYMLVRWGATVYDNIVLTWNSKNVLYLLYTTVCVPSDQDTSITYT